MPGPDAAFRVLFVCVGNVCRSALAERLLRARLGSTDRVEVTSAGVLARAGDTMDPDTVAELIARGGSPEGFVSRQLEEQMLREADLVLVATRELRSRVLEDVPAALRRTFTIREFAALLDEVDPVAGRRDPRTLVAAAAEQRSSARLEEYDVPDPFRRGPESHAIAARLVSEAVERIAKALAG